MISNLFVCCNRRADSLALDWDLCCELEYFILELSIYWSLVWVFAVFPSCLFFLGGIA